MKEKGTKKFLTTITKYFMKIYRIISRKRGMGMKKKYLKSGSVCKVTFRFPKDAAPEAKNVTIVGDFNNWSTTETPLKKLKNGTFSVTLDLQRDREYQFRYLVDSTKWENDWNADKYVPAPYGNSENSVVVI